MLLSFVMPCYGSEKSIGNVIDRIICTVEKDGRYNYEIICVNDFSPDGTYEVLRAKAAQNEKIKVINLTKNFGQHAALMAGFHYVSGEIVICLDDDGQNPPEEMFKIIDKLGEGYDLVSAKYEKGHQSFVRKIGTFMSFKMAETMINKPKDIDLNSYYAVRRNIVDSILTYDNPYPFVHGLILRATRNMANVYITKNEREYGNSGYNFKRLFMLWFNGFTAFSEKPLRAASIAGLLFAFIGFVAATVIVLRKLFNPAIQIGYSSLMAAICFFSGIILTFLGLIGEYIGRIYISINNSPQFVVKETLNIDKK